MAKPTKLDGIATREGDAKSRPPAKLSSGIMGMKFMQQEPDSEVTRESSQQKASSESTESSSKRSQHGYFVDEDPGRWAFPGLSKPLSKPVLKKSVPSLGYTDIFDKSPQGGRRTYGAKPKGVDPEEMVKHYEEGESRNSKKTKKPPSRKRLSSERAEETARPKQRRKS